MRLIEKIKCELKSLTNITLISILLILCISFIGVGWYTGGLNRIVLIILKIIVDTFIAILIYYFIQSIKNRVVKTKSDYFKIIFTGLILLITAIYGLVLTF
jgi:hypothetical protein